jgi:hypothetical protein
MPTDRKVTDPAAPCPLAPEINTLIRIGCAASDAHLSCSYPECKCRVIPRVIKAVIAAVTAQAKGASEAPGHTDLMVTPESLDKWLESNPPPESSPTKADVERVARAIGDALYGYCDPLDTPNTWGVAMSIARAAIAAMKGA